MKCSMIPDKKYIERVEQEVYDVTVEACQDNNAMFLIALNETFGFGKERLNKIVRSFNEVSERFTHLRETGYSVEDIHKKLVDELDYIGIAEDDVYTGRNDFYAAKHHSKMINKNQQNVSIKESIEAQKHMLTMKELLNNPAKPYVTTPSLNVIQVDETTNVTEIIKNDRVDFYIR